MSRAAWTLLPLLLFLAFGVRADWLDAFRNTEQRAQHAYQNEDFTTAANSASPLRRGSALYRQGDFTGAAQAFADAGGFAGAYNRGNALARGGDLEGALAAYEAALKARPDDPDAKANRDLIKKLLEQQRKRKQQQKEKNSSGNGSPQERNKSKPGDKADGRQADSGKDDAETNKADKNRQGVEQDKGNAGKEDAGERPGEQDQGKGSQAQAAQQTEGKPADSARLAQGDHEQPDSKASSLDAQGDDREGAASPVDRRKLESAQALEQWLRRIPDDPGGLLREKFRRQAQRR